MPTLSLFSARHRAEIMNNAHPCEQLVELGGSYKLARSCQFVVDFVKQPHQSTKAVHSIEDNPRAARGTPSLWPPFLHGREALFHFPMVMSCSRVNFRPRLHGAECSSPYCAPSYAKWKSWL